MKTVYLLETIALLVYIRAVAHADSGSRSCPGIQENASIEKQITCWFDHDQHNHRICTSDEDNVNKCTSRIVSLCNDAPLDNASVSTACFLSYIRAEKFQEARNIAEYLQSDTPHVIQCLKALELTSLPINSTPDKADIYVNDVYYGQAPTDVSVSKNWWETKIAAKFNLRGKVVEIPISHEKLMQAFDHRNCTIETLVVIGPDDQNASTLSEIPLKKTAIEKPPPKESTNGLFLSSTYLWGHAAFWTGIGLVGFGSAAMLQASKFGKDFDKDPETEDEMKTRSKTWAAIMWTGYGLGVGFIVTGILLWTLPSKEKRPSADRSLAVVPEFNTHRLGGQLKGSF